jgi:hypothetical protein
MSSCDNVHPALRKPLGAPACLTAGPASPPPAATRAPPLRRPAARTRPPSAARRPGAGAPTAARRARPPSACRASATPRHPRGRPRARRGCAARSSARRGGGTRSQGQRRFQEGRASACVADRLSRQPGSGGDGRPTIPPAKARLRPRLMLRPRSNRSAELRVVLCHPGAVSGGRSHRSRCPKGANSSALRPGCPRVSASARPDAAERKDRCTSRALTRAVRSPRRVTETTGPTGSVAVLASV